MSSKHRDWGKMISNSGSWLACMKKIWTYPEMAESPPACCHTKMSPDCQHFRYPKPSLLFSALDRIQDH